MKQGCGRCNLSLRNCGLLYLIAKPQNDMHPPVALGCLILEPSKLRIKTNFLMKLLKRANEMHACTDEAGVW